MNAADAAGTSPLAGASTSQPARKPAGRHSHRGGKKHHRASPPPPREKKQPPPRSCAPCAFGCGCWFRHRCSHVHSPEDFAKWDEEKDHKTALIKLQADKLAARLAGRSARRSLSDISNTTTCRGVNAGATPAQVLKNTEAPQTPSAHKIVEEEKTTAYVQHTKPQLTEQQELDAFKVSYALWKPTDEERIAAHAALHPPPEPLPEHLRSESMRSIPPPEMNTNWDEKWNHAYDPDHPSWHK